jgi:hypothetical protein
VYGSKDAIVRLFQWFRVVNDMTLDSFHLAVAITPDDVFRARKLLAAEGDASRPTLRSGLYVLRPSAEDPSRIYVVYWPEQTTWNDDADESVRRNRVTFMRYVPASISKPRNSHSNVPTAPSRYLTKIADQVVALISPEHARGIAWSDDPEYSMEEDEGEGEEDDRLYRFEVAKTKEEDENVQIRQGFEVRTVV